MSGLSTITIQCQFGITIRSAIMLPKNGLQKASYLSVIFFISESFITHEYLQNTIGVKCNFLDHAK